MVMGCLIVGYYFYLSNRDISTENRKSVTDDVNIKEVKELIAKKIDTNYPGTPIEVTTLYLRIMKAYYRTELSNSDIEKLGKQARILFDDELLEANPWDTFIDNLKADIVNYNKKNRYVNDYKVERNSDIMYKTMAKKYYAIVDVTVYVREGKKLVPVNMEFTLRRDDSGNWKILFWRNKTTEVETE